MKCQSPWCRFRCVKMSLEVLQKNIRGFIWFEHRISVCLGNRYVLNTFEIWMIDCKKKCHLENFLSQLSLFFGCWMTHAGMDFHELLDIPQGDRRKYHDDVSVMVISLEGRIWRSSGWVLKVETWPGLFLAASLSVVNYQSGKAPMSCCLYFSTMFKFSSGNPCAFSVFYISHLRRMLGQSELTYTGFLFCY